MSIMKFKNWWSAKPYWFKGGILGVIIGALSFFGRSVPFLDLLTTLTFGLGVVVLIIMQNLFGPENRMLFTESYVGDRILPNTTMVGTVILFITILSVYFLFGAITGWIIGFIIQSMKSRKTSA